MKTCHPGRNALECCETGARTNEAGRGKPGCADLVIFPESVIFCASGQVVAQLGVDATYFEGVYPVPVVVKRVHEMHGGRAWGVPATRWPLW